MKQVPLPKHNTLQSILSAAAVSSWEALTQVGMGVLVLDINTQCLYWNSVLEKLTGISAAEAMTTDGYELLACFTSHVPEIAPEVLFGKNTVFPDIQKTDVRNTLHWLSANLSPLRNETGDVTGLLCLVSDVTEKKQKETGTTGLNADQAQIFQHLKDFYDNTPVGYHCLDREGYFQEINETELTWLGYTREEVIGIMHIDDILAPSFKGHYENNIPNIIRDKGARGIVLQLQRKNGTAFFVELNSTIRLDENGSLMSTRACLSDITEKKKAEEDLHSKEELFRKLIESSSDIILILDKDLKVEYASPSVERILGYKPVELIGKVPLEHIHADDKESAINALENARNKPGEVYSAKYRHQHRNGSWKHMEASGSALLTNETQEPLFIINVRDIS
ncbi:MAG TPA: PAS domain-containing protein, partial [Bacteroidia bacterium]|nr:PAS domain-containing protein [Bacteroidia bacterium]